MTRKPDEEHRRVAAVGIAYQYDLVTYRGGARVEMVSRTTNAIDSKVRFKSALDAADWVAIQSDVLNMPAVETKGQ